MSSRWLPVWGYVTATPALDSLGYPSGAKAIAAATRSVGKRQERSVRAGEIGSAVIVRRGRSVSESARSGKIEGNSARSDCLGRPSHRMESRGIAGASLRHNLGRLLV